ncbi:hypothetical protein ACFLZ2_05245 [Candidatus Margulisiibacteriota bacterium]
MSIQATLPRGVKLRGRMETGTGISVTWKMGSLKQGANALSRDLGYLQTSLVSGDTLTGTFTTLQIKKGEIRCQKAKEPGLRRETSFLTIGCSNSANTLTIQGEHQRSDKTSYATTVRTIEFTRTHASKSGITRINVFGNGRPDQPLLPYEQKRSAYPLKAIRVVKKAGSDEIEFWLIVNSDIYKFLKTNESMTRNPFFEGLPFLHVSKEKVA